MTAIYIVLVVALAIVFSSLLTVTQGTIAVITLFGKYKRILTPGLRMKIPFLEQVYRRISIQNQSIEMEFQAVTIDQANVYFKSMLLYSVMDAEEETIKKVAFKFVNYASFQTALVRSIESAIRSLVGRTFPGPEIASAISEASIIVKAFLK